MAKRTGARPSQPGDTGDDDPTTLDPLDDEGGEDEGTDLGLLGVLPEEYRGMRGANLLAEMCVIYGINPDPDAKPRDLRRDAFKYYPPDTNEGTPARMVIVTAGGRKLTHPPDADTLTQLRIIFKTARLNRTTGEVSHVGLPEDLTLPRSAADGKVRSDEHQYKGGYLKAGGKAAADARDALMLNERIAAAKAER